MSIPRCAQCHHTLSEHTKELDGEYVIVHCSHMAFDGLHCPCPTYVKP